MKRINTTLTKTILGLILTSLCLTSCGKQTDYRGGNNTNVLKPEDRPLRLAKFEQIHGTRYLMAEINEVREREYFSSSSGGNGRTRNLVFLDGESLTSHKLFDNNAYIILRTRQYPSHDSSENSEPRSAGNVTQWLVHEVLKADTNGDGRMDGLDQLAIAVTDAGGSGYAEILGGIDDILTMTMLNAGQVLVVYSRGGVKSVSVIDLENRKVLSTKAVTDLGNDVR